MLLTNGKLPGSVLRSVPWAPTQYVRYDILDNLIALNKAFRSVFGYNLTINEGYRTFERQQDYYANPPSGVGTAAVPGTSNHGWGLAIDFGGLGGKYGKAYLWLMANGPKYGFVNPLWARDGKGVEEPWHWESSKAKNVVPDIIVSTVVPTVEDDEVTDYLVHHVNGADQAVYLVSGPSIYALPPSPTYPDLAFHRDVRGLPLVRVDGPVGMDPIKRAAGAYAAAIPQPTVTTTTAATIPAPLAIDYAALAKAVNDDAARRLAE